MRTVVTLAALVAAASPAFGSGGFWCNTDDASVKFSIDSGVARGAGNPIFNFRGEMEIAGTAVAADLRKSHFKQEHLMQHWLDDKMMNLQLYRERGGDGPFGEINLTIETKRVEEGSYEGSYALRVYDMTGDTSGEGKTIELAGKTNCFAE